MAPRHGGWQTRGFANREATKNGHQHQTKIQFWLFLSLLGLWEYQNRIPRKNYVELTIGNRFWWISGRFCRYGVGARSPLLEAHVSPR